MPAPPRCPTADVNRYRLAETPVIVNLLELLPGDAPYSTHLELEGVRSRLVDHGVRDALRRLAGDAMGAPDAGRVPDYGGLAAETPLELSGNAEPARRGPVESPEHRRIVTAYTATRRMWPAAGLIDLVI